MSPNAKNERLKITAALLNTVASASIVAGVVTPLAALAFGFPTTPIRSSSAIVLFGLAFVSAGLALHWIARAVLRYVT